MIDALYSKPLLRLAADAAGAGRLAPADAAAEMVSSVCGDRIAVTVRLNRGKIVAFAHETKACVLCQAAAALLSESAIGLDAAAIEQGRQSVATMLAAAEPGLDDPRFSAFAVFAPVADYGPRHGCVLFPFKALLKALRSATT